MKLYERIVKVETPLIEFEETGANTGGAIYYKPHRVGEFTFGARIRYDTIRTLLHEMLHYIGLKGGYNDMFHYGLDLIDASSEGIVEYYIKQYKLTPPRLGLVELENNLDKAFEELYTMVDKRAAVIYKSIIKIKLRKRRKELHEIYTTYWQVLFMS